MLGAAALVLLLFAVAAAGAVCGFIAAIVVLRENRRTRRFFVLGVLTGLVTAKLTRGRHHRLRAIGALALRRRSLNWWLRRPRSADYRPSFPSRIASLSRSSVTLRSSRAALRSSSERMRPMPATLTPASTSPLIRCNRTRSSAL